MRNEPHHVMRSCLGYPAIDGYDERERSGEGEIGNRNQIHFW